jgi:hypothetical protein
MSDAVDMLTATQDALIAALQQRLPPEQQGLARHTLMEGTAPPFHLIGDLDAENIGSKGEQLELLTADIYTVYRGTDRRELLGLMHPVRLALDDQKLVVDGIAFRTRWAGASASRASSDGVTFAGVTQIEIYAEPV